MSIIYDLLESDDGLALSTIIITNITTKVIESFSICTIMPFDTRFVINSPQVVGQAGAVSSIRGRAVTKLEFQIKATSSVEKEAVLFSLQNLDLNPCGLSIGKFNLVHPQLSYLKISNVLLEGLNQPTWARPGSMIWKFKVVEGSPLKQLPQADPQAANAERSGVPAPTSVLDRAGDVKK